MAIVFALNVWRGIRTGYVGINISGAKRADSPKTFWFGMVLSLSGAIVMTLVAASGFGRLS
ncbi:hypothetical protein [Sphingomonas sp. RS2018]